MFCFSIGFCHALHFCSTESFLSVLLTSFPVVDCCCYHSIFTRFIWGDTLLLLPQYEAGSVYLILRNGVLSASLLFLCQYIVWSTGRFCVSPPSGSGKSTPTCTGSWAWVSFLLLPSDSRTLPLICAESKMCGFPVPPSEVDNFCFLSVQGLRQIGFLFHVYQ